MIVTMLQQAFRGAICAFFVVTFASAEGQYSVDRILGDTLALSEIKCRDRGQLERNFLSQGKPFEARQAAIGEGMMCECFPEQVRALRASLPEHSLQQQVTQAHFQEQYVPRIMTKCAAEGFRATYGEGCGEQFSALLDNSNDYCECMQQAVSQLSDEDALQLAAESSAYAPRVAEAQRRGAPLPEKSPMLTTFVGWEASCRNN